MKRLAHRYLLGSVVIMGLVLTGCTSEPETPNMNFPSADACAATDEPATEEVSPEDVGAAENSSNKDAANPPGAVTPKTSTPSAPAASATPSAKPSPAASSTAEPSAAPSGSATPAPEGEVEPVEDCASEDAAAEEGSGTNLTKFADCTAAAAKGFKNMKKGVINSGYDAALDRNGDGVACEAGDASSTNPSPSNPSTPRTPTNNSGGGGSSYTQPRTPSTATGSSNNSSNTTPRPTTPTTPTNPTTPNIPAPTPTPTVPADVFELAFSENFSKPASKGTWEWKAPNTPVYFGATGTEWYTADGTFTDDIGNPYLSGPTVTVNNGALDINPQKVQGVPTGAYIGTGLYQTYGKYQFDMKVVDAKDPYRFTALLVPFSENPKVDGAPIFPDSILNQTKAINGYYVHFADGCPTDGCIVSSTPIANFSTAQTHTYTIEWTPGRLVYKIDNTTVLDINKYVPTKPMSLNFDVSSTSLNKSTDTDKTHILIDNYKIWSYKDK